VEAVQMTMADLFALAAPYGPSGILIAYFVWREHKRDEREGKREERLEGILKDNAEADKQMAVAMTLLAERVR